MTIAATMAKFKYSISKSEVMAKGWSSLNKLEVEAVGADGSKATLAREVADHGHAIAVLPIDQERNTILLVKQWRAGAAFTGHDGWLTEVCAGLLDADETPENCARREALEELGVELGELRFIANCFMSPGAFSERVYMFLADYSSKSRVSAGGGLDSEHEDIEVIEMPLAQAFNWLDSGEIADAKTIMLLQAAKLQLGGGHVS